MQLRDYQQDVFEQLKASTRNDLVQLDTGAGKTPIEAALAQWAQRCMIVAHRITLIRQISEKLAAFGLAHDTVSTEHTRRRSMSAHRPHGRNYIQRGHATRLVVSIDSLHAQLKRGGMSHVDLMQPWLVIIDEAHHVVPDNKWGKLRELMPNARIVGFTATPARMDGESLHVCNGGLFDRLVQARGLGNDSARMLIERGFLSDFIVYAPPRGHAQTWSVEASINAFEESIVDDMLAATADAALSYRPRDVSREFDKDGKPRKRRARGLDYETGTITLAADPVLEYKRLASGTQAIMMCPAIKNAEMFARQFREAGVSAAAIHSTMAQSQVTRALDAFAAGQVRVICNVDMIGEGFDMPAVQTLIIASQTASFPRYRQWVGRVLRLAPGKQRAIILDLTGQVQAHGLPDEPVEWDLLNPPCGPKYVMGIPCDACGAYYKIRLRRCPECGADNEWLRHGKPLGNFEFDVRVLKASLVQAEREAINAEKIAARRKSEIIWPSFADGYGLIGSTISDLRKWFVGGLQSAGVDCEWINDFLESEAARDSAWWMANFTAGDLKRGAASKSKRVYQQWLKTR